MRCLSCYRGIYFESMEVIVKRHTIAGVLVEIRSKGFYEYERALITPD